MPRSTPSQIFCPSHAGLSMMAEIAALGRALENPERPVMAIVGGAKVSTKIEVLTHLVTRMDVLVVGGGMANTFLLAQGMKVGASLCEPDFVPTAKDIMARAARSGLRDRVAVGRGDRQRAEGGRGLAGLPRRTTYLMARSILDFGPESVAALEAAPQRQSGPCCGTDRSAPSRRRPSARGRSRSPARSASLTKAGKLVSVAGGGDTVTGAERGRRRIRLHLCLDRGRRLPRMARRPRIARRSWRWPGAGPAARRSLPGKDSRRFPCLSFSLLVIPAEAGIQYSPCLAVSRPAWVTGLPGQAGQ